MTLYGKKFRRATKNHGKRQKISSSFSSGFDTRIFYLESTVAKHSAATFVIIIIIIISLFL